MPMSARFNFDLGTAGKTSLTIVDADGTTVATSIGGAGPLFIQDNGDGTYYCDGLSTGTLTVKDSGTAVDGLENVSFAAADLLQHLDDSTPHSDDVYSESEVDALIAAHHASTSTDHDDRYYTETEVDNLLDDLDDEYAPGDEDGPMIQVLDADPTANSANEGRLYILRSGNATTGSIKLCLINRTDYNGTSFEVTVLESLASWSGS